MPDTSLSRFQGSVRKHSLYPLSYGGYSHFPLARLGILGHCRRPDPMSFPGEIPGYSDPVPSMPRPALVVPGPPKPHNGRLRVWWRGRHWDLGREGDRAAFVEYERLRALWAVDPNAGRGVDESDYLLADLVADFLESADSPRTGHRARYKGLAKLLGENGGETPVKDFGPVAFRAWVGWLAGLQGPKGSRFNRVSVGHIMSALRRVIRWGVSTERVEAGQLEALATVPGPRAGQVRPSRAGRMASADPRAVRKALPLMPGPVRAMVELQILTGARPSELLRMRVGEVLRAGRSDLPGVGLIELGRKKVWVYVPTAHKTSGKGADRWLIFGPKAQAVLRPFLSRRRPGDCVFDPRTADRRRGRTGYARAPGKCYSADTYAQAIERACDRAGVDRFTPYMLRRLASREIDAGFGREATAATLGHAHPDTSAIYTGRNFEAAVRVARERG